MSKRYFISYDLRNIYFKKGLVRNRIFNLPKFLLRYFIKDQIRLPSYHDITIYSQTYRQKYSIAKSRHIPLDVNLKTGGWRSIKFYAKYNTKLIEKFKFAQAILHTKNRTALK